MNRETFQLEGTWEQILTQSEKLTGHRVRVIVLPTETEIKQEIALESQEILEALTPETLINYPDRVNLSNPNEPLKFGHLPHHEQESIRQALASQIQGKSERWEYP